MSFSLAPLAVAFCFVVVFTYFAFAGGNAFDYDEGDALPALLGQSTFLCTGAIAAFVIGRGIVFDGPRAGLAAVLLAAAVALYEWARRTIRGRNFHLAWTGDVPDAVCDAGPYARIRHPIYLAYMLAFFALLVAMPGPWTAAILLFNLALFTQAAFGDERSLAHSPLAEDYAAYRRRVGMFFPRRRPGG